MTNVLYNYAHDYFAINKEKFKRFESNKPLHEDKFVQPCEAPIAIVGMGRVGMGAYNALNAQVGKQVWGLDTDKDKVRWLNENGIQAYLGDAEDARLLGKH